MGAWLFLFTTQRCWNKVFKKAKEEDLPDNVFRDFLNYKSYKVESTLTDNEVKQLIMLKQTERLETIKNCLIFFVVLTIIGIIIGIVGAYQIYSAIHAITSASSSYY